MSFTFGFEIEGKGQTLGLMKQVHGATLIEKDSHVCDREADGVFTSKARDEVFVFTADCLPVLFASSQKVAAVHAGWRGTKKGIINAMLRKFPFDPSLKVILGPCLKSCCFEVRDDFIREFSEERGDISPYLETRNGRRFFDLPGFALQIDLKDVPRSQIDLTYHRCTFCSEPTLPSFRRTKGTDPRIRAWVKRS